MRVADVAFDVAELRRELIHPSCGGFCAFEGWVRDSNAGAPVDGLDYEAYAELAVAEGERVIAEAMAKFAIVDARCVHRVGTLAVGDLAIWIGVAAAHRDAAFSACRYIIDEAKTRLPVWKKEHYLSGESSWVTPAQDEQAARVEVPETAPAPFAPDYSRQMRLAGFGPDGQARLAASRVLVIGAGGLGVAALSYLAGAGIGTIGIVDGDRLDASNLHRQVMYSAADIGRWKVDLAARRLRELNPAIAVDVIRGTLSADSILGVFDGFDIVLECTDDMRSKYLCSDAAVATGTPIVFASVYQYEGQLHAWAPETRSPCMRCLWPVPPDPGAVGTCGQAGVLGPVPGILGAMQAIEAIKRIVGLPGAIEDSLLLVNLLDYGLQSIVAGRAGACAQAGRCVVERADVMPTMHELAFARLDDAITAGYAVIDIRNADEIDAEPLSGAVRIPMAQLLGSDPSACLRLQADVAGAGFLIVCSRGLRSAHVANHLRGHGVVNAWSLAGGLAALR